MATARIGKGSRGRPKKPREVAIVPPPPAPSTLVATTISGTQINLTWVDTASDEVGFIIERCSGENCAGFGALATLGAGVTSYADTGLTEGTVYRYRVKAYNAAGTSSASNIATATTTAPAPDVPAAPTGLTATALSATQIRLTWTDTATSETGYSIERCLGASCTGFVEVAQVGYNVSTFTDAGLVGGTVYRYRVRALGVSGNSSYTAIAQATTLTVIPPTPPAGSASLLRASDITYLGRFLLPPDGGDNYQNFGYSWGALTGRRHSGVLKLLTAGRSHEASGHDRPLEISYPGTGTGALSTLPRATLLKDWSDAHLPKLELNPGDQPEVRGLHYENGYLWMAYSHSYAVGGFHYPSLLAVALNDGTGLATAYGPWRTTEHSQRTRGYVLGIPAYFTAAYTPGKTFAVGAPLTSGAAGCNIGAGLMAVPTIDPTTYPPNRVTDAVQGLTTQRLIWYDREHPQARGGNYRVCGWNVPYDCGPGSYQLPGPANFGNEFFLRADSGTIRDKVTAGVWIKNATKEGVLFIAEITKAIAGESYAGVPTEAGGMPDMRYSPNIPCCHGHPASGNPGTGPNSDAQALVGYIYDPAVVAHAAQGLIDPWIPYAEEFDWAPKDPTLPVNTGGTSYVIGGAYFDATASLLFILEANADRETNIYSPRGIMHVFAVAGN